MTKRQIIVRSGIILYGLICLFVVGLLVLTDGSDDYQKLDSITARFEADPSLTHLRDLMNFETGGAGSYYQMALIGAAFSRHPGIFREASDDLQTGKEESELEMLAFLGSGAFEYYPELKPPDFDLRLREEGWLRKRHGKDMTKQPDESRKAPDDF